MTNERKFALWQITIIITKNNSLKNNTNNILNNLKNHKLLL